MIRDILGVSKHNGPLRYLGVLMSGRRLGRSKCVEVKRSIWERLEGWQVGTLSMMGRVTLVRSVFNSISVYLLSNTILPKILMVKLEQHFQRLMWGSSFGGDGVYLLASDII